MPDDGYDGGEALDALSHPDRVAILRALVAASRASPADPWLRFSTLKAEADIDDTGRFNYHLGELVGTHVRKGEDGYRLSAFGRRVVGPMLAGAFDAGADPDPVPIEPDCPECGAAMAFRYRVGTYDLVCAGGHELLAGLALSPGAVGDRDDEAARALLGRLLREAAALALDDVCPVCHCRAATRVHRVGDAYGDTDHLLVGQCGTCGNRPILPVGAAVLVAPAVADFLAERGDDPRTTPPWRHDFFLPGSARVVATDPPRMAVTVRRDGDALTATVDRDGGVAVDRNG